MRSYFVLSLHLLPYLCMRAANALMNLSICRESPEPSLLAVISTKIPCTCPYLGCTIVFTDELILNELSFECRDPTGTGVLDPLKNHKNIGFLSNTGPDPLKKSQNYQAGSSSARQRNDI